MWPCYGSGGFRRLGPLHRVGPRKGDVQVIPEQFGRLGVLVVLAIAFPALPLLVSYLFYRLRIRPQRPDPIKTATYECGVESEGSPWGQFNVRYYLFALGFVIFDVEVIFLYPWAVQHASLNLDVLFKAALFMGILAFGLAYAWRRRALEWQ
jgi:NADH:ubiquinone oxidoreductase subunit 3 (subunit A)